MIYEKFGELYYPEVCHFTKNGANEETLTLRRGQSRAKFIYNPHIPPKPII